MQYKLVTYRTSDYRYNQYAVVPTMWLSDLLDWLKLSESAEIVSVTDNLRGIPDLLVPETWPSYRTCLDHVRVSDLIAPRVNMDVIRHCGGFREWANDVVMGPIL